jgi:hypothetical protein
LEESSPQRLQNNKKEKKKERKKEVATLTGRRGAGPQINDEMQTNYEHNKKLRTFVEETLR